MQIWRPVPQPCLSAVIAQVHPGGHRNLKYFIKPQANPLVNPMCCHWCLIYLNCFLDWFCSIPSIFLWTSAMCSNWHLNSQQARSEGFSLLHLVSLILNKKSPSLIKIAMPTHTYTLTPTHSLESRLKNLVTQPIKNCEILFPPNILHFSNHVRSVGRQNHETECH